jgi:hypothetical protein
MEDKIKYELNELMKKDSIETKEAVDYLRKVSRKYIDERNKLLRRKQRKDAKAIHDELAYIYSKVANKVSNEEVRRSLKNFVFYWLRSGETEIFIEPSLPKLAHKATKKVPEISSVEEPIPVLPTVMTESFYSGVSKLEKTPIMKSLENLGTASGYPKISEILNLGDDII